MPEEKEEKKAEEEAPPRLCSEIQLFDLCARDVCGHKKGRYCTKEDILAKFEAILDEEDRRSPEQFMADGLDDVDEDDDLGDDETFDADDYGDDEYDNTDEE
jgi:hypothetical protein